MIRRTTVLALALASTTVLAQQDFSKVEIKSEKLSEGLHVLMGAGGNIGVSAGPDGVLLIDDQYAPLTPRIRAAVALLSDKPIKFVLNTHWHGDHVGGNQSLGENGALIVAHENVRKRMSTEQFIEKFKQKVAPSPATALPVVTFTDSVTLNLNGEEIVGVHVPPAHTDGDTIVHFKKANVLHMGDTFFNGGYPFIDLSSGGSVDGVIAAADKAMALANDTTKIIPGHGAVAGKEELKKYRAMLVACRDAVAPLVKAGKSLKEILDAKPTAAYDETLGKGFIKSEDWVGLLVDDAKARAAAPKPPVVKSAPKK